MTDINQHIMQKASGEQRLNPDEQKRYFGTFRERVVLTISLEDARQAAIQAIFSHVIDDLKDKFGSLTVKISPNLETNTQIFYMKIAQEKGLQATIVDEDRANSPFGVLVHTNKAENKDITDIRVSYASLLDHPEVAHQKKASFLQHLFCKH
ncbi:DUF1694 domain-containing protein [Streptococcus sp. zg-JUN1979]|uniref:DUF1694 domain-containing protein n=1 Tax=Streptococcus sp. zg-JUN1979 TaxID=3391450 RepID=UPI0039A75B55